jgi:hypothetical protein
MDDIKNKWTKETDVLNVDIVKVIIIVRNIKIFHEKKQLF